MNELDAVSVDDRRLAAQLSTEQVPHPDARLLGDARLTGGVDHNLGDGHARKARTEINDLKNGAARALYAIDQLIADLSATK